VKGVNNEMGRVGHLPMIFLNFHSLPRLLCHGDGGRTHLLRNLEIKSLRNMFTIISKYMGVVQPTPKMTITNTWINVQ
jgi:hypothetical protein